MLLLQRCSVALMHVLEHSVQCGVEKPCRPAALGPESHQLRALGEAWENCADKKTKGQMLQSPEAPLQLWLRLVTTEHKQSQAKGKRWISLEIQPCGVGERTGPSHLPSAAQVMLASLSTLISASSSNS